MSSVTATAGPVHFRFGDALRTIAIFFVVLSHIVMVVPFLRPLEPYRLALGSWGVNAFFVLSGFLLSRPYIDALLGRASLPSWKRYARRRFLRIWPAYATIVLFAFGKSALHHGANAHVAADTIAHLLMIHNFFPSFVAGADNIALWTMAVDAQFYVALPVVAWLLYQRPIGAERRDITVVLGVVCLVSILWRIAEPYFATSDANVVIVVQRNVLGMGTSFAVGAGIAYLGARGLRCPKTAARLLVLVAIATTIADFVVARVMPAGALHKEFALDILGTLAIGLIVFAIPRVAWRPLDLALDLPWVAVVAANAYALYLLHVPIKQTIASFLTGHGVLANTSRYGMLFSLGFCACCLVSTPLLHRFVEVPFLSLKERAREITIAA